MIKKVSAIIFFVLAITTYAVFDIYISTSGEEFINNWFEAEAPAIQQGDILSSIAKGHRIFRKSEFVKGLGLYDKGNLENLVPVGERFDINQDKIAEANSEISLSRSGFLAYTAYKEVDQNKGLVLVVKIYSVFFNIFYVFTLLLGAGLLIGFYRLINYLKKSEYEKVLVSMKGLINQLSHDTASPLQVINNLANDSKGLDKESKQLIGNSVNKIEKMIKDVFEHKLNIDGDKVGFQKMPKDDAQKESVHTNLALAIKNTVSAKKKEYQDIELNISTNIETNSLTTYSPIDQTELSRVLSNLINNSIESKDKESINIKISLMELESAAKITVEDNGCGIDDSLLPRLTDEGASFNKASGKGLGLHHAKTKLQEAQGELLIESKVNEGTFVTLLLPLSYKPNMSLVELLESKSDLTVIDDDPIIHDRWDGILVDVYKRKKPIHASKESDLSSIESLNDKAFVVDFELGRDQPNGLEIIEKYNIKNKSILSTFSAKEPELQQKCFDMGLALLPKENLYDFY